MKPQTKPEPDRINLRLLGELTKSGRQSFQSLAERERLSINTVRARVRAMEDRGIIRGYEAVVNDDLLGQSIHALVFLRQMEGRPASLEVLQQEGSIRSAYRTGNEFGLVLEMVGRDVGDLQDILRRSVYNLGYGRPQLVLLNGGQASAPVELQELLKERRDGGRADEWLSQAAKAGDVGPNT